MRISIIIFTTLFILNPIISFSQVTQIYKHPLLNFQFTASEKWINISHPEDELIYEMMSPDSNMHVMLWYTETEQDSKGYLSKMADMKDLSVRDEEPFLNTINNLEIWALKISGYNDKMPIQTLLAVSSVGLSVIHPKEKRLFIIQIWCQKYNYSRYKSIFDEILNSVQIENL